MKINEAVKLRIENLCFERGLTIHKLAINSGINHSTLQNIISNKRNNPTISTIKKICDGLSIDIIEFYNDSIFYDLEQEIK